MRFSGIFRSLGKHPKLTGIPDHPSSKVDWSGLAGIRDIITHRYFRVDWHLIWTSIDDELLVLKMQIQDLMKEEQG